MKSGFPFHNTYCGYYSQLGLYLKPTDIITYNSAQGLKLAKLKELYSCQFLMDLFIFLLRLPVGCLQSLTFKDRLIF